MTISNGMNLSNILMQNQIYESQQRADTIHNERPDVKEAVVDSQTDFQKAQLAEVAKEFEKIFVNMMFTAMRNTLRKEDDIFYSGLSQDIFDDMLYEEYAEQVAATNMLGLGQMIVEEYERYL